MTSEGLGEMFKGDSADMCTRQFPLVSMGGRSEGLACTDPGASNPINASGIDNYFQKLINIEYTLGETRNVIDGLQKGYERLLSNYECFYSMKPLSQGILI